MGEGHGGLLGEGDLGNERDPEKKGMDVWLGGMGTNIKPNIFLAKDCFLR